MTAILDTSFLFALTDLGDRIFSLFAIAVFMISFYEIAQHVGGKD